MTRTAGEHNSPVEVVLYRRRLSLTSGTGQLIRMQAEGLESAGERVLVLGRRGRLKFSLTSGVRAHRVTDARLRRFAASSRHLLVDHGMEAPDADLVFVHNLMAEAVRHVPRSDWEKQAASEARFFRALGSETPVVANSKLVRAALIEHFALSPDRISVHYPGYDAGRFPTTHERTASADRKFAYLRRKSRRALGVSPESPLVGFVTSGELDKRGLDIFLDTAEQIGAARGDVRFLVVGARRLPEWATHHPLVTTGRLLYRPKGSRPEHWFAALDIFLFPARFEEFGLVVSEARACKLPVLTSRRVGAAECLPAPYDPWLLETPDSEAFAEKALALLADHGARVELTAAGTAGLKAIDQASYVRETIATIRRCIERKEAHFAENKA